MRARNPSLLGSYRPGSTVLHRTRPGVKLALLAAVAIVLVLVREPLLALAALALAAVLTVWTGGGWRAVGRTLRGLALIAVALGGWLAWQQGWPRAVDAVGDLAALVLLASVLTATTSVDDMLDTLTRAFGPFRRFGASPEKVALAFSMTIRAIPTTLEIAAESRDAALARGLQRSPRARLVPLVIRVVAHARATGDALHARGIGDD